MDRLPTHGFCYRLLVKAMGALPSCQCDWIGDELENLHLQKSKEKTPMHLKHIVRRCATLRDSLTTARDATISFCSLSHNLARADTHTHTHTHTHSRRLERFCLPSCARLDASATRSSVHAAANPTADPVLSPSHHPHMYPGRPLANGA